MIYHFLLPLASTWGFLNVLRYISFRAVMAALTAFVVSFLFGPWLIRKLTAAKIGQHIRPDGPERHQAKAGTPTMGGTLILSSLLLATLLLADLTNQYVWLVLLVTMVYGPIAAWLVELFPTRIRYTSMSLPYHIGNGWFGGFLPTTAFAIVAATGNIYAGLWYPIIIAGATFVIGMLFLPETKGRPVHHE